MKQKIIVGIIGFIVLGTAVALGILYIYNMFTPSNEKIEAKTIFEQEAGVLKEDEAYIILNNEILPERAVDIGGAWYVSYEQAKSLCDRIFYDNKEKLLVFTTPDDILTVKAGEVVKTDASDKTLSDAAYLMMREDEPFILLDFVKENCRMTEKVFDDPSRIVIFSGKDQEYLFAKASKDIKVRNGASIREPYITELKEGESVMLSSTEGEVSKSFVKIITEDGIKGYVKESEISKSAYEKLNIDFKEPVFKSNDIGETVNLTWHALYVEHSGSAVREVLNNSKGINVLAPTWFKLQGDEGEYVSLANKDYVDTAHDNGIKVFAVLNDVEYEVNDLELLAYTSKRMKLQDRLIKEVKEYGIDGINLDLEKTGSKTAPYYIEFIRELSVNCHKEGIILSVDTAVPLSFNTYLRRDVLGQVCDYVMIMAYDEHYAGSDESGSVSSISWVRGAIENSDGDIPKEKLVIGIPFYTRLWEEKKDEGQMKIASVKTLRIPEAEELVKQKNAEPVFNEEVGQDYVQYEEDGSIFKIWLENETSIRLKCKAIKQGGCQGIASWKFEADIPWVWDIIEEEIRG